jgi:hypothetical protein
MAVPTHAFYADPDLRRDWRGDPYCSTCGLPKRHECHEVPERPPEDVSERIVGERELEGAG